MPKVYVVQANGHDFSKARSWGTIETLFDGKVNVFASDALAQEIREKLEDAEEGDFLCLSGSSLANCMAYSHLLKTFGRVNVLIYSHRDDVYELRTVRDS